MRSLDPIPVAELILTPLAVEPGQQGCGYWVEIGPYRVLLDCGFGDPAQLDQLPQRPDLVICSHAHWDHLQALPQLHQRYPDVPLYGTRLTHRLAQGLWRDPQGQDLSFPPLRVVPFQRATVALPDLTLMFLPAGHLPGAAVTVLHYTGVDPARTVVYTGDLSLASLRFVEGLDLETLRHWRPDVLLLEGTLGADRYPSRRQAESRLVERLAMVAEQGGISLVPVPDLGLGQELLFLLKTHHRFTHSDSQVQIWVDAQVGRGCDLFEEILADLPRSVQNFAQHQSLFWESRVHPWVCPLESLDWDLQSTSDHPGIILCHAQAPLATWRSLWCRLQNLDPDRPLQLIRFPEVIPSVPLESWPQPLRSRLQIERSYWHSHADSNTLVQLIHTLRPQHVVFGHGDLDRLTALADLQELCDRYHVHCPSPLHPVDLPSAPTPSPAEPEVETVELCYEGEVSEVLVDPSAPRSPVGAVQVLLPPEITQDPRWQVWADTGVVEARWQEDQLVIRGMSPKELVRPVQPSMAPDQPDRIRLERGLSLPRCGICQFLQAIPGQPPRCDHPASPMYRQVVDLEGQCLQFQPISAQASQA